MDMCEHAYYKPEEKYYPYLYCKIDYNKRCIYSKKCQKVERFIPLENEMWRECPKYIMEKIKNIPKGSNLVQTYRPNKNGKLYIYVVVDENEVQKILTDFTELNQDYVYLKKTNNGYKVSLSPFPVITKNNKKEIKKSKDNEKEIISEEN